MKSKFYLGLFFGAWIGVVLVAAAVTPVVPLPTQAISLEEALGTALAQNPAILQSKQDLEEAYGISLQQRAVYLPRVSATGAFSAQDPGKIEGVALTPGQPVVKFQADKSWNAGLQISQPVFGGGRLKSALRASKLTQQAAVAQHESLVANTLLEIRIAYLDILLAAEQIGTQEASVRLLEQELADTRRRFEAGTVPRFNVLRAEVELANARPRLIKARNTLRTTKNNLATLLGYTLPPDVGEDIPLATTDHLQATTPELALAAAIAKSRTQRTELVNLQRVRQLREEDIKEARADLYPQFSVGAGYGVQSRTLGSPVPALSEENHGWTAGAQMNWNIWDLGLTKGKVVAATARREKARLELEDTARRIELQVRTAYSGWTEAKDILAAQQRVIEQGDEALRLANARAEAGSGTQLDVLSSQTALTEARNTFSQALRDHAVAWARLERAMGDGVILGPAK